jgi:flagellar assembly protein FliH
MPSSSRIVFAEDLAEAAPWTPGALEGARRGLRERLAAAEDGADAPAPPRTPTYEDGLRDGYARGLEEARGEAERARRLESEAFARRADGLLAALTAQLAEVQQAYADEVVGLAVEIARSAFGAALRVRDDAVVPAVAAALAAIGEDLAKPVIRLHPDDAALVAEQLAPMLAARGAQLVADDAIAPGGCRVDTVRASVDATVATRWRRALAALGRDDEWVQA